MSAEEKVVINRNRNIDVVRGVALLCVVVYHIWVLTGSTPPNNMLIKTIIMTGGELGVTLFLVLSGYGIYHAINKQELSGGVKFRSFIKKRWIRVVPEYYLAIILALLFTTGAQYISKKGIKDILYHLFFIHNFDGDIAYSINPVLWTMAVIVQFYIIAIPLYKLLKRVKWLFPIIFIAITICYKYIMFHHLGYTSSFWASRQTLISVIDNFALGMFTAWLSQKRLPELMKKTWFVLTAVILDIIVVLLVEYLGIRHGIHIDTVSGYIWHSVMAVCVSCGVFFYSIKELFGNHIIKKGMLWISKYEYGVYIVHLIVVQNMLDHSSIMKKLSEKTAVKYFILLAVSIFAGWILSKCADGFRQSLSKKEK